MSDNDLFKFVSLRPAESSPGPSSDTPIARRLRDVRERHSRVLPTLSEVAPPDRFARISEIKERQAELGRLVKSYERIQRAINGAQISAGAPATGLTDVRRADTPANPTGPDDQPKAASGPEPSSALPELVEERLSDTDRSVFRGVLARLPPGSARDWAVVTDGLTIGPLVDEANTLCAELRALEETDAARLPTTTPSSAAGERPIVSAVGWGDLVVARESLAGYVAREIAHVENVLPGEAKLREHERISTTEQVEEVEITTEKQTEKDSQSTDRYELQAESQEVIQQSFAIQSGVNTSGRYGLTKVETTLDGSFQQSQSQSQSSSTTVAREIVSRAVERTFERVRELRRLTVTEKIRELNRHDLSNTDTSDISGLYLWLEKIHRVELRQYGSRLMIEFHIPEPAVSLLEARGRTRAKRGLPPFEVGPQDVYWGNYLCLGERYGSADMQPPPPMYVNVGWTWASTPAEEGEEDAEDTIADKIAIPDGYRPVSGWVISSALQASTELDLVVAVGGSLVVEAPGQEQVSKPFTLPVGGATWPNGVPVAARVHGHWDKTMAIQVVIRCERTAEAYTQWQLRIWEALRSGYEALRRQVALDEQENLVSREILIQLSERSASENRRIERHELQKWAIKAMRLRPQNFNAIEQVGEFQEVSPLDADMQAPIVRMFEDAFEWDQMTYFLYPYYWARRESWRLRVGTEAIDPRFKAFLEAGAARVIVPVTPGFEAKVLAYLESDPNQSELERITTAPPDTTPSDSPFEKVWVEILTDRKADLALGSGTLQVEKNNTLVRISSDSQWAVMDRDAGRELYIAGERFTVASRVDEQSFHLDRPYPGDDDSNAIYAAGSVPFGPPWTVNVPTSLIILAGNRPALADLGA